MNASRVANRLPAGGEVVEAVRYFVAKTVFRLTEPSLRQPSENAGKARFMYRFETGDTKP